MSSDIFFGNWKYQSSTGILNSIKSGCDKDIILLSTTQRAILNLFLENPQRLVSKKEIQQLICSLVEVNELQVVRLIADLRNKLGDDSRKPIYIETVRKRGFRFVCSVNFYNEADLSSRSFSSLNSDFFLIRQRRYTYLSMIFFVASLIIIFVFFEFFKQKKITYKPSEFSISNLSSMDGIELDATVSPDGEFVAYTNYYEKENIHSIVLQNLKTKSAYKIKSMTGVSFHGVAWLSNGSQLIYQSLVLNKSCQIRKISFDKITKNVIADEVITSCGKYSYGSRLQVTPDQDFIYYPSKDSPLGSVVIMKYSFASKSNYPITSPPSSGTGDYSIALSPDGNFLSFLRDATKTHSQLWLINLKNNTHHMLYESPGFYPMSVNWTLDQKNILLPSRKKEINVYSLVSNKVSTVAYFNEPVMQLTHVGGSRFLVSGGYYWNSTVWKNNNHLINDEFCREKLFNIHESTTVVKINHVRNRPSVLLSDRSGEPKLWFYYPDGRQVELNNIPIQNEYTKGAFSPDGRKLLILTGNEFWLIEDEKKITRLSINYTPSMSFSWGMDGVTVYYTASNLGLDQVFALNTHDGSSKPVKPKLTYYEEFSDGSYAVQLRHGSSSLEIVKSDNTVFKTPITKWRVSHARNHVLGRSGVYFYQKADSGIYRILRFNIHSGAVEDTGVSQEIAGRGMDVSNDERFLYTDDGMKGNLDIREIIGLKI